MHYKYTLIVIFTLFPNVSYSYLDPGTGSILLQGLIASLAAIAVAGNVFWSRIKDFFSKSTNKKSTDKQDSDTE